MSNLATNQEFLKGNNFSTDEDTCHEPLKFMDKGYRCNKAAAVISFSRPTKNGLT